MISVTNSLPTSSQNFLNTKFNNKLWKADTSGLQTTTNSEENLQIEAQSQKMKNRQELREKIQ